VALRRCCTTDVDAVAVEGGEVSGGGTESTQSVVLAPAVEVHLALEDLEDVGVACRRVVPELTRSTRQTARR
jgi:hypothetical protein